METRRKRGTKAIRKLPLQQKHKEREREREREREKEPCFSSPLFSAAQPAPVYLVMTAAAV
jgi:hypothetical protein